MKTISFEISDAAFELLEELGKGGIAEYRDSEYRSLQDFRNSDDLKRGEEWFMNRNHRGTLYLIDELNHYNLVEPDFDAWHMTYRISEFGVESLNKQKSTNQS